MDTTNYCPLCEHYVRAAEKLNDENRALREENARLKARLVEMYERIIPEEIAKGLERLTRERDEARAEVEKERAYADASNQDAVAAEAKLARVVGIADHGIPYYAYGDNEAAVEMSHRLEQILVAAKEE